MLHLTHGVLPGLQGQTNPRPRELAARKSICCFIIENLLENTDGTQFRAVVGAPHQCSLRVAACYLVFMLTCAPLMTSSHSAGQQQLRTIVPGLQNSKRARGVVAWAALQQLGVDGVAALVDGCCDHAARLARLLCEGSAGAGAGRATLVHDVIFNQALISFGSDERTAAVAAAVQRDGRCWVAATSYHGQVVMRLSVSSWMTTRKDVDIAAEAILEVANAL